MMAYLTRRRFSNGGEVLPKPKPKLPQIKLYVDKLKTYLEAGAIEPDYAIQLLQERMKKIGFSNEELAEEYSGGGNEEASLLEEYYGKDQLDWMNNHSDQMTFEEYLQWKRAQAAQGGRIGFSRAGLASAPWFRGATGPNRTLKAPRGKEMLEWLPETGALTASAALALRPREKEELITKSVTETGEGLHIGDTGEKEKERERIAAEERAKYDRIKWGGDDKIKMPIHTGHPLPEIKKEEPPVSPPVEIPQLPGFGEGFEKPTWKDFILYSKKDDISEQTKKLVPDITADVSKENVDKYFEGIDELYDNEWYGSAKSIRDFIDNTTVDNGDKVYDIQKSMYTSYGMERPIHEFFEDEYQGGVGNLGNKDAAMVMQMGDLYKLGEFNGPEYYQEYIDKLHEYTLNTLGKEFKVYRLTRKDEMEAFLNPDRPEEATDTKSFSLSKNRALAFQGLWHDLFTTKEGKPREDLVLIETIVPYDSLIMRGHSGEDEIIVNSDFLSGNEINFYDLKGNLIKGADKELKKIIKKAMGGLIDKPLTGGSRYI